MYFHGNDGWDNATTFAAGVPLVSPDLSSLLVLQMDLLADWAAKLGLASDAERWKAQAGQLLESLLDELWTGERFVSIGPRGKVPANPSEGDCLLNCLPIILGKRLPADVRKVLVATLSDEGRFLTPHGLASESLRSPLYDDTPDSYCAGASGPRRT